MYGLFCRPSRRSSVATVRFFFLVALPPPHLVHHVRRCADVGSTRVLADYFLRSLFDTEEKTRNWGKMDPIRTIENKGERFYETVQDMTIFSHVLHLRKRMHKIMGGAPTLP